MSDINLLEWMDGHEMQPIVLLAWAGEYEDRGTILTRDVARIREICAAVVMPRASYNSATFPDGIEGVRIWTADDVVEVRNVYGEHVFEVQPRNPPEGPDREWKAKPPGLPATSRTFLGEGVTVNTPIEGHERGWVTELGTGRA